jgi:TolA-binding protein
MNPTTLRLPENTLNTLADEAEERGLSRSEYIREIIYDRHEDDRLHDRLRADYQRQIADYEAKISDYEKRIVDLETENERIRNEKRLILEQREENTELVEYVEEQRELTKYQERRQRLLDDANILRRWKWKLTGVPVDQDNE